MWELSVLSGLVAATARPSWNVAWGAGQDIASDCWRSSKRGCLSPPHGPVPPTHASQRPIGVMYFFVLNHIPVLLWPGLDGMVLGAVVDRSDEIRFAFFNYLVCFCACFFVYCS